MTGKISDFSTLLQSLHMHVEYVKFSKKHFGVYLARCRRDYARESLF